MTPLCHQYSLAVLAQAGGTPLYSTLAKLTPKQTRLLAPNSQATDGTKVR